MIKYFIFLALLANYFLFAQNKNTLNTNITDTNNVDKVISLNKQMNIDSLSYFHQLDSIKILLHSLNNKIDNHKLNLWTPLIAYVIAGIISLIVALITVRANVISRARIKWIQDLRNTMSEFLSLSESITSYRKEHDQDEDEKRKDVHISHITRMLSNGSKLKLLLNNENEPEQVELINTVIQFSEEIKNFGLGDTESKYIDLKKNCILKTQRLLKKEWDRAKKESISIFSVSNWHFLKSKTKRK